MNVLLNKQRELSILMRLESNKRVPDQNQPHQAIEIESWENGEKGKAR